MPRKWQSIVHSSQTESELEAIRRSVNKGIPFGSESRVKKTTRQLALGVDSATKRPAQETTLKCLLGLSRFNVAVSLFEAQRQLMNGSV